MSQWVSIRITLSLLEQLAIEHSKVKCSLLHYINKNTLINTLIIRITLHYIYTNQNHLSALSILFLSLGATQANRGGLGRTYIIGSFYYLGTILKNKFSQNKVPSLSLSFYSILHITPEPGTLAPTLSIPQVNERPHPFLLSQFTFS